MLLYDLYNEQLLYCLVYKFVIVLTVFYFYLILSCFGKKNNNKNLLSLTMCLSISASCLIPTFCKIYENKGSTKIAMTLMVTHSVFIHPFFSLPSRSWHEGQYKADLIQWIAYKRNISKSFPS